jgi:hypothetical protein
MSIKETPMPWKLYVDSRKRVKGARHDSDSSFTVQLPYPISVSGKAYVDVVLLSNTFYTIRVGENDRIYVEELDSGERRVVMIAAGQYNAFSLKDALQAALRSGSQLSGSYIVEYDTLTNRLKIHVTDAGPADTYNIWTDEQLEAKHVFWIGFVSAPFYSADRVCGFMGSALVCSSVYDVNLNSIAPFAPDLQPYQQLFIRSSLGGGASEALECNGETDIIRRVVVGSIPLNATIHDTHATGNDYVSIAGTPELGNLWFQLVDVDGKTVDTHGHPISFSIIFQDVQEKIILKGHGRRN